SAFFNVRVLFGLCTILIGVFLALAGSGVFAKGPRIVVQENGKSKIVVSSEDPLVPAGFDCSKIQSEHIYRQENFRAQALMIACGEAQGGGDPDEGPSPSGFKKFARNVKEVFAPLFGAADVDLITGTETSPN